MGTSRIARVVVGRLFLAGLMVWSIGCGRSPGPNDDDVGMLSYWLFNQSVAYESGCTDSPDWSSLRFEPIDFSYWAWYVILRVEPDMATAVGYDCTEAVAYDPNMCWPTDVIWRIDGHVFSIDEKLPSANLSSECTVVPTYRRELIDDGTSGEILETVTFELIGDPQACSDADDRLRRNSNNGKGLRGCVFSRDNIIYFARSVEPVR